MARKMSRSLVALSASAIAAVYAAGYVRTAGADARLAGSNLPSSAPAVAQVAPPPAPTSTPVPQVTAPPAPRSFGDSGVGDGYGSTSRFLRHRFGDGEGEGEGGFRRGGDDGYAPVPLPTTPPAASAPAASAPNTSAPAPSSASRSTAASGSSTTSSSQSSTGLKDGTYTGVGTSRRGDVEVSLIVQSGRIQSVQITGYTTQYPIRLISALPGEVVQRQSAKVDFVGGATFSSMAFQGAVAQALSKAQA